MMIKLLIIEDEIRLSEILYDWFCNRDFQVTVCHDGISGYESALKVSYDAIISDVMLPDMDGFTLCQRIRENHLFPIIMLTAKIEDMDKIMGLTLGADDYITKPFNPLELMARVKTQLRRYIRYNPAEPSVKEKDEINIRGLHIEKSSHKCTVNGKELVLTPIEFNILWYLCERKGNVVSSEELFEAVWGEKYLDNNNTVMAHIARLREKMHEPARKPKYVKTVWGVGYTIEA